MGNASNDKMDPHCQKLGENEQMTHWLKDRGQQLSLKIGLEGQKNKCNRLVDHSEKHRNK